MFRHACGVPAVTIDGRAADVMGAATLSTID
jgi:hypothetical protein